MTLLNQQRYASAWVGLGIMLMLGLSLFFSTFDRFDRWIYDELTQHSQFAKTKSPKVLLVELDAGFEGLPIAQWFRMLDAIQKLQPASIGINTLPWNWSEQDLQQASKQYSVFISSTLTSLYKPEQQIVYSIMPPLDGISYRQQLLQKKIAGKAYIGLEAAMSNTVFTDDTSEYFINFIGGAGRIPVINYQRILAGGLVSELVKDKAILIGIRLPLMQDMLTPLGMMNISKFQAHALDTLLNKQEIKFINPLVLMIVISLLVCFMLVIVLRIPDHYQLIAIFSVALFSLILSAGSYIFFQFWLLPGYLIITEMTVLIALLFLRNRHNKQTLQTMAFNSAAKIEKRWLSESFYSSDIHWNHIANMVTQTLSLQRTIFLERVENDHRVREIKALNCSLDDISEMRRDYQRTPYTTAIEYGGALKLERKYLEIQEDDEVQYIVPLNYAGNIQGFWAFTIKPSEDFDENKLIDAVEQFAIQISELLYHRSEWEKNQKEQRSMVIQLLEMKFEESNYESIQHSISFLTHRLSIMESLMDGLESSAILYDLFGRVVHVNKTMTHMLTDINLIPYSMTAVDLIVSLSGVSMAEARNYLSYLILEQGSINIPVKHHGVKTGYMMMVSALKGDTEQEDNEADAQPFELIGILCEIIDMTRISEIYSQKEKVVQHMSGWLRNDLSSITMACDLVQDYRIDSKKRQDLIQLIKYKVDDLGKNFEQVNNIVQQDLISKISSKYPVDFTSALETSVVEVRNKSKKSVEIESVLPFCSPLVMAAPKELRQVFSAVLNVLIADALEDSYIKLTISCNKQDVEFEFKNQGFGIPDEQLQQYLTGQENLESEVFQNLRKAHHQVKSWGGGFNADSMIGEGICFRFSLNAFQLNNE